MVASSVTSVTRATSARPSTTIQPTESIRFLSILSQVIASLVKNIILFNDGLAYTILTIIIGALHNQSSFLTLNTQQTSWFGSMLFIFQPLGCIMSCILTEPFGRKVSMMFVHIPFFAAWLLLYFAQDVYTLYAASGLLGFGIGYTEAPTLTYLGEISQPQIRGVLTGISQLSFVAGTATVFLIGHQYNWKTIAAGCALLSMSTACFTTQVPETPQWLISRGRIQEAEASLCWLRGWTDPSSIQQELQEQIAHHNQKSIQSNKYRIVQPKDLFSDPVLKHSLIIMCAYFFFSICSGTTIIRVYLIIIIQALSPNSQPKDIQFLENGIALSSLVGTACLVVLVKYIGKRRLAIMGLTGCAICTGSLALLSSYGLSALTAPPILFTLNFLDTFGVSPLPWIYLSEIFPFRGRIIGSGLAASWFYLMSFVFNKSFLPLVDAIGLSDVLGIFSCLSMLGTLFILHKLPETEGKTLEQIENEIKTSF